MEFDHVVLLEGGRLGRDPEEARRLLYVGMTRARETLCLMRRRDLAQPFSADLAGEHLFERNASVPAGGLESDSGRRYQVLGLKELDVGFAGRYASEHPMHRRLAALQAGCELFAERCGDKIVFLHDGMAVARLSQQANTEWLPKYDAIERVTVLAMIRRRDTDGDEDYRSQYRCAVWEVPFVEVRWREST
ncbi:MAG: ATP-binding domain-containing protein, partial [Gammaproteobacteria bacterium]